MADGSVGMIGWQRRPEPLKSFDGVGFSARATTRIDGGKLLHEILVIASHALTEIELKIGNDSRVKLSGTELVFLEQYKKQWTQNYVYVVPLADTSMVSLQGEILSGLNTTKDMDIELAATMGAGSGTPSIRAMAITSAYDLRSQLDREIALFAPRIRKVQLKGGGVGDLELDNVHQRRDGTEWIRRVHLYGGSGDAITRLQVMRDDEKLCDILKEDNDFVLKRAERAPQTNWFHFDPLLHGFAVEMFNTAHLRHLKFIVTLNGTVTGIPAIIETVEVLSAPAAAK